MTEQEKIILALGTISIDKLEFSLKLSFEMEDVTAITGYIKTALLDVYFSNGTCWMEIPLLWEEDCDIEVYPEHEISKKFLNVYKEINNILLDNYDLFYKQINIACNKFDKSYLIFEVKL